MLSPEFTEQESHPAKTKTKSFYFSGSLLNRVYLSKDNEAFYPEKRGLAIRKIKSDLVQGTARTENNSTYSTIMESGRVASVPSEHMEKKTGSSGHFDLCLVTEGCERQKEEQLPKGSKYVPARSNRTGRSKKKLAAKGWSSRPEILNSLLQSGDEFRLLYGLLRR